MNWYYVDQGQQAGPVDDSQFAELLRTGKVRSDTLVWREGMAAWQPYREVAETPAVPPAPEAGPAIGGIPQAVCGECGQMFPTQEMIRHGSSYICANCKPVFMQKLAEGARIQTGELNYAGFGTRFAAYFLDALLLGVVNFGIAMIAGFMMARSIAAQPQNALLLQLVIFAINLSIGIAYEVTLIGKYGATLGKMACKIKVVTADNQRVTYLRALGRYFAKMLSSLTCLIGFIIAAFDGQKRALHDHICNTRVVVK